MLLSLLRSEVSTMNEGRGMRHITTFRSMMDRSVQPIAPRLQT